MLTTTVLIGLGAVGVTAWYYAEWHKCTERGERMSIVRDPLALFALTLKRLWRNRSLVMILLGLWLVSGLYFVLFMSPSPRGSRLQEVPREVQAPAQPPAMRSTEQFDFVRPPIPFDWILGDHVLEALPHVRKVRFGNTGVPLVLLAFATLGFWLVYLWARRPRWLPGATHRRIAWPAFVTLSGLLVLGELAWLESSGGSGSAFSVLSHVLLAVIIGFAMPFFSGVLYALLWHLMFQVGKGQQWSLRRAVRAAIDKWLPVAWLYVIMILPLTLCSIPQALQTLGVLSPGFAFWMLEWLMDAHSLVWYSMFVLVFVPWIIMASRRGLGSAIVENFRMILRHWRPLAIFAPRYLAVAVPTWWVLAWLSALARGHWMLAWDSGSIHEQLAWMVLTGTVRYLFDLVVLVVPIVLYLELRKSE